MTPASTTPGTSDDLRGTLQDIVTALRHAQASGRPWALCDALACAGRAYRILSAPAAAISAFELALRWSHGSGCADQRVDVLCELCETHVQLAEACADAPTAQLAASRADARHKARELAFEAATLARHAADPGWEVTVLLRLGDLMDRVGAHDDATAFQARALLRGATMPEPPPDAAAACGTLH